MSMRSSVCAAAIVVGGAWAGTARGDVITVINPSFEAPDAGKIKTGFDSSTDVPGWSSGTMVDSGVEKRADARVSQTYVAFLKADDASFYQTTSHTIAAGEEFDLGFYVRNIYQATNNNYSVSLYKLVGGTRTVLGTATGTVPGSWGALPVMLEYTATAADAGHLLGIEVDHAGATAAAWAAFDDFAIDYTPVPEPASVALVALGGLAMLRRRT